MTRPFAIDLCAGAGGMSLGLQRAGFDVHGVEVDADAVATHRAQVGPCDRSEIECWRPPRGMRAALVAGGVPCQSFSAAGARGGLDDPRGRLYRHLLRVAVECDAAVVLLENVAGLTTWRSADGTTALRTIDAAYREHGYEPISRVICAADYGVPQLRYRLFVAGFRDPAHAAAFRWPEPTHAAPGSVLGLPPWVTVRQALGLGPERHAHGRIEGAVGWAGQRMLDVDRPGYAISTRGNPDLLDRPACTQTASGGAKVQGRDHGRPSRRPEAELRHALAAAEILDRPATTVQAAASGRVSPAGHHERQFPAEVADEPARTIDSTNGLQQPGNHARQKRAVRLTVAQCAALQDFPPDFVFVGNRSSQHRQIGNACPPALAEHVGRAIRAAIADREDREAAE